MLKTLNLFILPETFRRTEVIELSNVFIIPRVFRIVNAKTKYEPLIGVPKLKSSDLHSLNNCGCSND